MKVSPDKNIVSFGTSEINFSTKTDKTEYKTYVSPQDLEKIGYAAAPSGGWRGLEVEDLTAEKAKRFSIEEVSGVVVVKVEPGSPADDAGIIPGDVIREINNQPVKDLNDYKSVAQGAKGDVLVKTGRGFFVIKESEE